MRPTRRISGDRESVPAREHAPNAPHIRRPRVRPGKGACAQRAAYPATASPFRQGSMRPTRRISGDREYRPGKGACAQRAAKIEFRFAACPSGSLVP